MSFALQDPNKHGGVRAKTALRRAAMLDVFALVAGERHFFAATTPFNVNDDRIFFHVHDHKSFESEMASHLEAQTLTELPVASLANQHCGDAYARYCGQLSLMDGEQQLCDQWVLHNNSGVVHYGEFEMVENRAPKVRHGWVNAMRFCLGLDHYEYDSRLALSILLENGQLTSPPPGYERATTDRS